MLPYIPVIWTKPIITVNAPPTKINILNAKASMNDSCELDGGVKRRYQLTIVHRQQTNIMAESQKGNAPPPGPSSAIQPIGNSALFHIR